MHSSILYVLNRIPLLWLLLCGLDAFDTAPRAWANDREATYLSNVRQVTDSFAKAGEGYFSPDGKQIVFQAVPLEYPFYQIYKQPLDGKAELISTGRGRTTCSYFHPDGETILFASSHLDPNMAATESEEREKQEGKKRKEEKSVILLRKVISKQKEAQQKTNKKLALALKQVGVERRKQLSEINKLKRKRARN